MSNPINDRYIKVSQPQAESERALENEYTTTILKMTLLKITILLTLNTGDITYSGITYIIFYL